MIILAFVCLLCYYKYINILGFFGFQAVKIEIISHSALYTEYSVRSTDDTKQLWRNNQSDTYVIIT